MKALELSDIASYLPYGLRVCSKTEACYIDRILLGVPVILDVIEGDSSFKMPYILREVAPILRPMSDLTTEITHKGEKMIPIVEIGKLMGFKLNAFDDCVDYVEFGWGTQDSYSGDSQAYVFDWDAKSKAFGVWFDEKDENIASCQNGLMNYEVIDWLNEHHFDYRSLIDRGLAVSTEKINPYEEAKL